MTAAFDIGDQRARGVLAGAGIKIQMRNAETDVLSGGKRPGWRL